MSKKCPFRKFVEVKDFNLYGRGIPMPKQTVEIFAPCIEKECAAYRTEEKTIPASGGRTRTVHYCYLCGKDPD